MRPVLVWRNESHQNITNITQQYEVHSCWHSWLSRVCLKSLQHYNEQSTMYAWPESSGSPLHTHLCPRIFSAITTTKPPCYHNFIFPQSYRRVDLTFSLHLSKKSSRNIKFKMQPTEHVITLCMDCLKGSNAVKTLSLQKITAKKNYRIAEISAKSLFFRSKEECRKDWLLILQKASQSPSLQCITKQTDSSSSLVRYVFSVFNSSNCSHLYS